MRHFHDWEIEGVMTFLQTQQKSSIRSEEEDKLMWKEFKSVVFSVKSFYHIFVPERSERFLSSNVWNSWMPVKMSFFAWEATWERILQLVSLTGADGQWLIVALRAKMRKN